MLFVAIACLLFVMFDSCLLFVVCCALLLFACRCALLLVVVDPCVLSCVLALFVVCRVCWLLLVGPWLLVAVRRGCALCVVRSNASCVVGCCSLVVVICR